MTHKTVMKFKYATTSWLNIPAPEYHCPLASTKLYCLLTEAHCPQLLPGSGPVGSRSRDLSIALTTEPPSHCRSVVAPATRHRLSGLFTYGLNGLKQEDEHPTYVPDGTRPASPYSRHISCTADHFENVYVDHDLKLNTYIIDNNEVSRRVKELR